MKRKRSDSINTPSDAKRRKINGDEFWISPSSIKNYMINDPILDFLGLHQSSSIKTRSKSRSKPNSIIPDSFNKALMQQGQLFEQEVYENLKKRFKKDIININGSLQPTKRESSFKRTTKAIKKHIPIIYQGVLIDSKSKRRGIPDLLVRNDYIHLVINTVPEFSIQKHAPKYFYYVIDIKYATLTLRADSEHLLNAGWTPYYKAQLYIYNQCLASIQNYNPSVAFILGRRWNYTKNSVQYLGESCFDRLAVVDFTSIDSDTSDQVHAAEHWVRTLRHDHAKWDLAPYLSPNKSEKHELSLGLYQLPMDELYPNMCNIRDDPYHAAKLQLANNIGEITTIWMCGPRNRDLAHAQGVYSWRDPRCTAKLLGFNGKRAEIIDSILTINRQSEHDMLPERLTITTGGIDRPARIEFFVDFEAVGGVMEDFDQFPTASEITTIFMINVGYSINTATKSKYKSVQFTASALDAKSEQKIFEQMIKFITKRSQKYHVSVPLLFHWGDYETIQWDRINSIHILPKLNATWYNMHRLFLEQPIVVRKCFDYSLKSVVPALHHHGLIEHTWDTSITGKDSTGIALSHYKTPSKGILHSATRNWKEFKQYNEVDCIVLWEILELLRTRMS